MEYGSDDTLMDRIANALADIGDYGKVTIVKTGPGKPVDIIKEKRERFSGKDKYRRG